MFTQHILTCQQAAAAGVEASAAYHPDGPAPDCVAIVCERDADGATVWQSHAPGDVDPLTRVNPSYPVQDWRAP